LLQCVLFLKIQFIYILFFDNFIWNIFLIYIIFLLHQMWENKKRNLFFFLRIKFHFRLLFHYVFYSNLYYAKFLLNYGFIYKKFKCNRNDFIKFSLTKNKYFFFRLRIAFKWMMRAFSGYLASNQLLALWDRILAYDSLEILSGYLY
jgi:hypothetical protein